MVARKRLRKNKGGKYRKPSVRLANNLHASRNALQDAVIDK